MTQKVQKSDQFKFPMLLSCRKCDIRLHCEVPYSYIWLSRIYCKIKISKSLETLSEALTFDFLFFVHCLSLPWVDWRMNYLYYNCIIPSWKCPNRLPLLLISCWVSLNSYWEKKWHFYSIQCVCRLIRKSYNYSKRKFVPSRNIDGKHYWGTFLLPLERNWWNIRTGALRFLLPNAIWMASFHQECNWVHSIMPKLFSRFFDNYICLQCSLWCVQWKFHKNAKLSQIISDYNASYSIRLCYPSTAYSKKI